MLILKVPPQMCVPLVSGGAETMHVVSCNCLSAHLKLRTFALLTTRLTVLWFLVLEFTFNVGTVYLNLRLEHFLIILRQGIGTDLNRFITDVKLWTPLCSL